MSRRRAKNTHGARPATAPLLTFVVVATAALAAASALADPSALAPPSASAPPLADPLAPAAQGQLQCYAPDVARRTCRALAAYAAEPGGAIDDTLTILISKSPPITARLVLAVQVKGGAVCTTAHRQDIDSATFLSEDAPLDDTQAAVLRAQAQGYLDQVIGQELCLSFVSDGGAFVARATLNGQPQPRLDQRFTWVSAAAGYTVGP
jgi:hypothetical protein